MTLLLNNNFSGERRGKNCIIRKKKAHFSLKSLKYFKKLICDFQLHIECVIFWTQNVSFFQSNLYLIMNKKK